MGDNILINQLTENAFTDLKAAPSHLKKNKVIVQYLDKLTEKALILSDGEFFTKALIVAGISSIFTHLKKNDIIEVTLQYYKQYFILLDYQLIYSGVPSKIGYTVDLESVVDFPTYFKSPKASNLIPASVWERFEAQNACYQAVPALPPAPVQNLIIESPDSFTDINTLTILSRTWALLARVGFKSKMIEYSTGKLFKVYLFDKTGSIELVFFNYHADKFFPLITEGNVYILTGATINRASKYNQTSQTIELQFNNRSDMCLASPEGQVQLPYFPPLLSDFRQLRNEETKTTTLFNVMASLETIGINQQIVTRMGKNIMKQVFKILDETANSVDLTVWEKDPNQEELEVGKIYVFQGVKKVIYNNAIQLSSSLMTRVYDTNIQNSNKYKEIVKFQERRATDSQIELFDLSKGLSNQEPNTLQDIINESDILISKPDTKLFFTTYALISNFGRNLYYDSCTKANCMKKVIPSMDGKFECPRCGELGPEEFPRPRYFGRFEIRDQTTKTWVTFCSDAVGIPLFGGLTVEDIKELTLRNEPDGIGLLMLLNSRKLHPFKIGLTARLETYNGEVSVRLYVTSMKPIGSEEPVELMNKRKELLMSGNRDLVMKEYTEMGEVTPERAVGAEGTLTSMSQLITDESNMEGFISQKMIKQ